MLSMRGRYYVVADPNDNSVTLSEDLFNHLKDHSPDCSLAQVFAFAVPKKKTFGFMFNPKFDSPTQLCDIQINDKYKSVGFESLCPSVTRMFYDFGMPIKGSAKFSVKVKRTRKTHKIYYQIERPYDKFVREYAKG